MVVATDEIQHGGPGSGRYPKGSGLANRVRVAMGQHRIRKAIKKQGGELAKELKDWDSKRKEQKKLTKQQNEEIINLVKARMQNDKMIEKGIKKLASMSSEEADAFIQKLHQISAGDHFTEDRIRSVANTRISEINVKKAKTELLESGLKSVNTAMTAVKKITTSDGVFNSLAEGLSSLTKAAEANKKTKKVAPTKLQATYAELTSAKKEDVVKQMEHLAKLRGAVSVTDIAKYYALAKYDERKNTKGGGV